MQSRNRDNDVDTLRNWYGAFLAANIAGDETRILDRNFWDTSDLTTC